jgi:hypothetical protein
VSIFADLRWEYAKNTGRVDNTEKKMARSIGLNLSHAPLYRLLG